MPELLKLSQDTITLINEDVLLATRPAGMKLSPAPTINWLLNIGGLISEYLPDFLKVFQAIAATAGSPKPSIAEFFAVGNQIFNPISVAPVVSSPAK